MNDWQQRFWARTRRTDDGCLVWTGWINRNGYGRLRDETRKTVAAHRVAWTLQNGAIPSHRAGMDYRGVCVLHACDNRACVEPTHLFLGTQRENMADRDQKGRGSTQGLVHGFPLSGARNGRAKLSVEQVKEIREIGHSKSKRSLAAQYGVARLTIARILRGERWAETPCA